MQTKQKLYESFQHLFNFYIFFENVAYSFSKLIFHVQINESTTAAKKLNFLTKMVSTSTNMYLKKGKQN